jgi:hypothetical protein
MRKRILAMLVLAAVMLCAGAAGTPVNGDASATATSAGINLSHPVKASSRLVALPADLVRSSLRGLLSVALAGGWLLGRLPLDEAGPPVQWRERHTSRGPPTARLP